MTMNPLDAAPDFGLPRTTAPSTTTSTYGGIDYNTFLAQQLAQVEDAYTQQQQELYNQRISAQAQLTGINPDFGRHISVQINRSRAGMTYRDERSMDSATRSGTARNLSSFGEAANSFWQMEGELLGKVQMALVGGGFLDPKHVSILGKHDPAGRDYKAWAGALEMAALTNKEVFSMLDELKATGAWDDALGALGGGGAGEKGPRRPDVTLMSAADAAKLADQIGQDLIGRRLTDDEKKRIVGRLHGTQKSEQNAAIDVAMNEAGGGVITNPTSPDTVLENELRESHRTEVQGTEALNAFNQLLSMMGGGR